MKKLFLFITFALVVPFAQAQELTCDSLVLTVVAPDGDTSVSFSYPTFVEMQNGTLLSRLFLKSQTEGLYIGDWFYKISSRTDAVVDSVFVPVDDAFVRVQHADKGYRYADGSRVLLAKNPLGDDYIYAYLVYNHVKEQTSLRIRHFDEDLNFEDLDDAAMVQIEEDMVDYLCSIMLADDEIILMYMFFSQWDTPVVTRVGLDGTLREKHVFPNLFHLNFPRFHSMAVFNDDPREYALIDMNGAGGLYHYYVLDSLFALKDTIVMEDHYGDVYPPFPSMGYIENFTPTDIMPLDDEAFFEIRQYERHNIPRNGPCIMKYDKATHGCIAKALFDSWPIYTHSSSYGFPIGLKPSADGNLSFAYRTNAGVNKGWIGIAKLDIDLNILWQRYCFGSWAPVTGYVHSYCRMSQTEDGFVIGGKLQREGEPYNYFFYFVHDNGTIGMSEEDSFIRPYMFYPNPAQDQLRLQYSPDVTPKQIELYDLQGRLAQTQSKNLESLNMAGLPAGTYTMRVMLEGGKVFSDKVVKE